ncbi:MAG: aquaporin [Deltaproteobacteria bacterium]|nr:aquaporin [Deltaproteobacteria bacterium]
MNPARSLAPALVGGEFQEVWVYLLAPVLGSGLAVVACRFTRGPQCCMARAAA